MHFIDPIPKTQRSDRSDDLYQTSIATPIGTLIATANRTHLLQLKFMDEPTSPRAASENSGDPSPLVTIRAELDAYFQGRLRVFRTPWSISTTPFTETVWRALDTIPVGTVTSYQTVATTVGHPSAVRAVGTAIGKNLLAIIIPCHRVIRHDGPYGQYAWGIDRKTWLIQHERSMASNIKQAQIRSSS